MRIRNLIRSINSLLIPDQNARSHAPWVLTRVYIWRVAIDEYSLLSVACESAMAMSRPLAHESSCSHSSWIDSSFGWIWIDFSLKLWLDLWRKWPLGFQGYHKRFIFAKMQIWRVHWDHLHLAYKCCYSRQIQQDAALHPKFCLIWFFCLALSSR